MGQPGQADEFLEVLGDKLRSVISDDSWASAWIFFPGSLQDDLDVELCHRCAQFPMQQQTRTAIQDRAEIEEGADDVQIGDIHMPVFMRRQSCWKPLPLREAFGFQRRRSPAAFSTR